MFILNVLNERAKIVLILLLIIAADFASASEKVVSNFNVKISGAVKSVFEGRSSAIKYSDGGIVMTLAEGKSGKTLVLTLPADAKPGDHKIVDFADAYKPGRKVVDFGASYSQPGTKPANLVEAFTKIKNGKLSLKSVNPLTGQFSFSAEGDNGGKVFIQGDFTDFLVTPMP